MIIDTITTDPALLEQHPLLPFEPSSNVDPLTNVLRFLDHAVFSRPKTFAMHFELHAPRGCAPFDFRRAFDRFLTKYLADLEHEGFAPSCAWNLTRTNHGEPIRLLLLVDGNEPNCIGMHLRSAERVWGIALGIENANGLVGYYDHPNSCGGGIGNGITIDSIADRIDANWADCFRWAKMLVDGSEGEITALPTIRFHGSGRDRSAATSLQD